MVNHESRIDKADVSGGAGKILKQILAGPRDGLPGYLREFTLAPGESTPHHAHDWYHLVYVLEGEGLVWQDPEEHPLERGSVVFVEANRLHHFSNRGPGVMRFLCLVPQNGDSYP